MAFCNCISPKPDIRSRLGELKDECWEFVSALGSWFCKPLDESCQDDVLDEWSDICFGIGRLLGNLMNKSYVPIWGDRRHVVKIQERMQAHGCVRSRRHLIDGVCPSTDGGNH